MHFHGSRCCSTCLCKKSAHPQVITCLVLRCLPTHWSLPHFRVSLHVFQSLHLLYSAQPPCGRNRRVQEPLRARRMRAWPCGVSKPSCTRECQLYKTDTVCKAGVKCLFPHQKVDEQPNKMPKKGYYSHKRRESDDKNAAATDENCTTIGPRLARLGSTGFSKRKTAPGTPDAKSWERFEEYDSLTLRFVKQVSGTERIIAWKYRSKIFISEVLTLWNLRTGPMKRLKDDSDAPEARHGTLPKTNTSSKRKTKLHSTRPRRNGYFWLLQ